MHYKFPRIEHINDVLPAIEGRDEFIVAERNWGKVVNYMVSMPDTFPPVELDWRDPDNPDFYDTASRHAAIRRECRGILFYPDGRIMSRRFHKFFNVNERDETQHHLIDLSEPHVILEKLDGSMITPVVMNWVPDEGYPRFNDNDEQIMRVGDIRWGTKMGITDVAAGAEEFVKKNPNYEDFARWAMTMGYTPIFEWCSRKQRIVVDYPQDRLVLIAARNTISGEYQSLEWMHHYAARWNVEVVKTYSGTTASMEHLLTETRSVEDQEGWIIRFKNGHMVKVKGDWYVRIHKTKDNLVHEKNVIDFIVNEKIDDVKSFMLDEDRRRVEEFENRFWHGFDEVVRRYEDYFSTMTAMGVDRKTWALEHMPTVKKQNPYTSQIMFGMYNGKTARELVLDTIRKNISTQTRVDEARILWGNVKWNYHFDADN